MKKPLLLLSACLLLFPLFAQDLYFPPLSGNTWESLSPAELNWCEDEIPELYDFLEENNTKAFLLLKDGKIVLEKYFNGFGQDSIWYWASAAKSLTAVAVGIAQEENLLSIDDPVSDYLGMGWTSLTPEQESAITIRHQLTMTTGLDDALFDCTTPDCLQYLAPPGTRWAYHNAPYTLLSKVIEAASGQNFNVFIQTRISGKTGMLGAFVSAGFNNLYFSRARTLARFGLLVLNRGHWDNTPVLSDAEYFDQMLQQSQDLNLAYGYLWWLNGSTTYQLPQSQITWPGPAIPAAPDELVAAIGKNGQLLNIVPSQNLLLVRLGEIPSVEDYVPNLFNSQIWEKLQPVLCTSTATSTLQQAEIKIFPNPGKDQLQISLPPSIDDFKLELYDQLGILQEQQANTTLLDITGLAAGWYSLRIKTDTGQWVYPVQILP